MQVQAFIRVAYILFVVRSELPILIISVILSKKKDVGSNTSFLYIHIKSFASKPDQLDVAHVSRTFRSSQKSVELENILRVDVFFLAVECHRNAAV